MKVAVGMPVYNAARYVGQAVQSIMREGQVWDVRLIAVDDGSTDDSWEILSGLARQFSGLTISRRENKGIAKTRNEILPTLLEADFVTWLDADDLAAPGRLARDLASLQRDPELDLVYSSFEIFRECDPVTLLPIGRTMKVRGVHLGAGLYRGRLLARLGSFDEGFRQAEDTDYLLRIFESGARYSISQEVSYYYRRHAANTTLDVATQRHDLARAIMLSAHRRRKSGRGALPDGIFDASAFSQGVDW